MRLLATAGFCLTLSQTLDCCNENYRVVYSDVFMDGFNKLADVCAERFRQLPENELFPRNAAGQFQLSEAEPGKSYSAYAQVCPEYLKTIAGNPSGPFVIKAPETSPVTYDTQEFHAPAHLPLQGVFHTYVDPDSAGAVFIHGKLDYLTIYATDLPEQLIERATSIINKWHNSSTLSFNILSIGEVSVDSTGYSWHVDDAYLATLTTPLSEFPIVKGSEWITSEGNVIKVLSKGASARTISGKDLADEETKDYLYEDLTQPRSCTSSLTTQLLPGLTSLWVDTLKWIPNTASIAVPESFLFHGENQIHSEPIKQNDLCPGGQRYLVQFVYGNWD